MGDINDLDCCCFYPCCALYSSQPTPQSIAYYRYEDIQDALYHWRTPAKYKINFLNTSNFTRIEDQFHLNEKAEKFVPKNYYLKFTNGEWAYLLIRSNMWVVLDPLSTRGDIFRILKPRMIPRRKWNE